MGWCNSHPEGREKRTMRVQYRCTNARTSFEPEYREYCAIGLDNCIGCELAELRMIKVTQRQIDEDEKHELKRED